MKLVSAIIVLLTMSLSSWASTEPLGYYEAQMGYIASDKSLDIQWDESQHLAKITMSLEKYSKAPFPYEGFVFEKGDRPYLITPELKRGCQLAKIEGSLYEEGQSELILYLYGPACPQHFMDFTYEGFRISAYNVPTTNDENYVVNFHMYVMNVPNRP